MGSLMAGWDSPVLMDPNTAKLERNRSLTKEEIDDFWKVRQRKLQIEWEEPNGKEPIKSPISPLKESPRKTAVDSPVVGEKDKKNGDWWIWSTSAFLNEPPIDDALKSAHKYAAQFDVAKMARTAPI